MRPATLVLTAGVGGILVADDQLIRRGHDPVTSTLRTPAGWVFLGLLVGHVAGVLPARADPFRLLGAAADRLADWSLPRGPVK